MDGEAVRQSSRMVCFRWTVGILFAISLMGAVSENPKEKDIRIPLVPADQLEQARALINPIPATEETRAQGKEIFKIACAGCHGPEGKGDGSVAKRSKADPKPRDFTNPEFQRLRTDGELFWVLKNGSHNTEMMRMDFFFYDKDLWKLILYIRTLK